MAVTLPTIRPGDIESYTEDFSRRIGTSGTISSATWVCAVDQDSTVDDPSPSVRLPGTATNTGTTTSHLYGNMLDGVIYQITVTASISDGRKLSDVLTVECGVDPVPSDDSLTVEQFRRDMPAFADPSLYSDDAVAFWVTQANLPSIDRTRWGQFYTLGLRLYVAHMLAVNRMAAGMTGAPVGSAVPASKSVGGVSISYDVQFGSESDAGAWGLTVWGNQYLRLLREAGAAPIQL